MAKRKKGKSTKELKAFLMKYDYIGVNYQDKVSLNYDGWDKVWSVYHKENDQTKIFTRFSDALKLFDILVS